MKRFLSKLIPIVLMLTAFCLPAGAKDQQLSMKYVSRTERGTLFYVDIASGSSVSAATFELHYDPSIAEYREVSCDSDSAAVIGEADNGTVKIAYSHHSFAEGKLFCAAFKAVGTGEIRFELHMTQAVDEKLNYMKELSSCTLDVRLGKDDVVESSSSHSSKSGSSASDKSEGSSKKSYGGSKSDVSGAEDPELSEDDGGAQIRDNDGVFRDYSRGNDDTRIFLLGAGSVILAGLLVTAGFVLGKRMKKKRLPPDDEPPESDEVYEPEEPEDPFDAYKPGSIDDPPENNLEDIFKDIE